MTTSRAFFTSCLLIVCVGIIPMMISLYSSHSALVYCECAGAWPWGEMLFKCLMPFLAFDVCRKVQSAENSLASLHQQLMTSWCEFHSVGIVYSREEYFLCKKENANIFRNYNSLKGVTLKIGIIEGGDFGYDCSSEPENGGVKSRDSYSQYLLSLLQEILQFDINFLSSTSWGYYEPTNHSSKGLIGFLVSDTIHVIGCHRKATHQLTQIADFLFSTLETTESFIYLPQNLPLVEDIFIAAFSRKLWIFFLLSIFLLIVSFWFSTYMHSRVRPDHEPWSGDEIVLWAVAAISQQSYSIHPRGSSCRTMFLIGYLITYLLYTGFAACITSLLALQSHQNPLTFYDVADLKLHLIFLRDEYYLDFFQESGARLAFPNIQSAEEDNLEGIFQKIKKTNTLGFGSTMTLLHYLHSKVGLEKREVFSIVPVPNLIRYKSLLIQKSLPYKHLLNYWLLRLKENGLLDLGKKRYLNVPETVNVQTTKWFGAGLENVFSALAFLFVGWILSVFVLFVEILSKKKKLIKRKLF